MRGTILGLAYSDRDLVVFLEAAGVLDPEQVLDDPLWVEWRGPGRTNGMERDPWGALYWIAFASCSRCRPVSWFWRSMARDRTRPVR